MLENGSTSGFKHTRITEDKIRMIRMKQGHTVPFLDIHIFKPVGQSIGNAVELSVCYGSPGFKVVQKYPVLESVRTQRRFDRWPTIA